ncbi:hypothetical protein NP233_g1137 [Leucocoprinus birnbaumii]|uniref:Uncharacterized protein n=1 Tax=Leucocoprinus birnbaumii TaxID=56174 RepID=A0AAD5YW49_9AGAR|nr:hypothetical protein NP233_g1137 [Leucocoprinus birnbaumii]
MKLRRRKSSLLALLYCCWISLVSVGVVADALSETGTSFQGDDVCNLKEWMATSCQPPSGSSGSQVLRRALYPRDDSNFTPSGCTCTLPFYNLWCGCNLVGDASIENVFNTWNTTCMQNNMTIGDAPDWLKEQNSKIPGWAFTMTDDSDFNVEIVKTSALASREWTITQITVPIIVGILIILIAGVVFFWWRRYHLLKAKGKQSPSFFAYVGSFFKRRAPSIVHRDRNDTWVIDGREHAARDIGLNENDTESLILGAQPQVVDSPTNDNHDPSRWSPGTSLRSPPRTRADTGLYSFTPPRQPTSIDQRVLGASTIRNITDRVKEFLPWVGTRPIPLTNVRPSTGYNIDSANRTRTNTLSTLASKGKGGYGPIPEDQTEDIDPIGTGRTRSGGYGLRQPRATTREEIAAVADSVVLIGDPANTIESGSTGHSQRVQSLIASGTPRVGRMPTGDLKSPSLKFDVSVEPPSPTLESMPIRSSQILPSPGAPPLLPPAPQARPPLPPPPNTRNTPRRTPSPHLRISTQFGENPLNPSGSNVSLTHSRETSTSGRSESQLSHRRDPLGSGGSGTGTNVLSYVTLPGVAGRQSLSLSDAHNNNPYLTAGTDNIVANIRRSGSGSRPLPPQPPEPPRPAPLAPVSTNHVQPVPSGAMTNVRQLPSNPADRVRSGPQPNDFDPYAGIPRPNPLTLNRHPDAITSQHSLPYNYNRERSASSATLPREPGDSAGQLQRGWSADDDMDRASIDQPPMEIDDGMSGSNGVYIAAPRDVTTLGAMSSNQRPLSTESFATAMTEVDTGGRNSHRFSSGGTQHGEVSVDSPTLSMLQSDPLAKARFADRRSVSGSSGWEAGTQFTHNSMSPVEPIPPLPSIPARTPNLKSRPLPSPNSPNLSANHNLSPQPSPRPSHVRLGSETSSINNNRSREELLNPSRNDPVRLFPASVRAAGYTTGLSPDSVPVPPPSRGHTPRPSETGVRPPNWAHSK